MSADVKPLRTSARAFPKRVCVEGGLDSEVVRLKAAADLDIASGMLLGAAVGWTFRYSFWTTAGTSVPAIVPFAIASEGSLAGEFIVWDELTSYCVSSSEHSS